MKFSSALQIEITLKWSTLASQYSVLMVKDGLLDVTEFATTFVEDTSLVMGAILMGLAEGMQTALVLK